MRAYCLQHTLGLQFVVIAKQKMFSVSFHTFNLSNKLMKIQDYSKNKTGLNYRCCLSSNSEGYFRGPVDRKVLHPTWIFICQIKQSLYVLFLPRYLILLLILDFTLDLTLDLTADLDQELGLDPELGNRFKFLLFLYSHIPKLQIIKPPSKSVVGGQDITLGLYLTPPNH